MLIAVRNDVMKETQSKQIPWEHSALTNRFYFRPPTAKSVGADSNSERWMALQTAPASTSFTPDDFQRVSSQARQKGILLPEFTVRQVGDEVAEANRRFVGVWVTNSHGLGGVNGRQFMVMVTNVDARGYVVGHIARGPPTALSLAQTLPAGHFPSQIANGAVAIKLGTGPMSASLDGRDRLMLLEQLNDGRQVTTVLDRVWSLVAPGSTLVAAEFNLVAPEAVGSPTTRSLSRQQLIDTYDRWLEKQVKTLIAGKGTNTYLTGRNPKAFAMCIDWGTSTPDVFVRVRWGNATNGGNDTRDEVRARALSNCRANAQTTCTCAIVHENGKRATDPPSDWLLKYASQ